VEQPWGEQELSAVLTDFPRTMVTDFPIEAILDRLVKRIVEILPITAAGVTLIEPGASPGTAASKPSASWFENEGDTFGSLLGGAARRGDDNCAAIEKALRDRGTKAPRASCHDDALAGELGRVGWVDGSEHAG
jgi:hypothetical protein